MGIFGNPLEFSAMTFECKRMLQRDGYLMWGFANIDDEDDLIYIGRTKTMIRVTNWRKRK